MDYAGLGLIAVIAGIIVLCWFIIPEIVYRMKGVTLVRQDCSGYFMLKEEGQWWVWNLHSENGQGLARSPNYGSRRHALAGIAQVRSLAAGAGMRRMVVFTRLNRFGKKTAAIVGGSVEGVKIVECQGDGDTEKGAVGL